MSTVPPWFALQVHALQQQMPALQRLPAGANKADLVAGAIAGEHLRRSAFARMVYLRLQARCIGPDPLAVGGCEWPPTLTSGEVIRVAETNPLRGWRMWGVAETPDGPRLVAPYLSAVYGADPATPGVSWASGTNTNSTYGCLNSTYGCLRTGSEPHPQGACRCGIRAVQSLTVLRAFVKNQRPRIGPPAAVAQVEVFGRVAGYAPDDDWQYTLRAGQARIVGALHVRPGLPVADLAEHYEVPVLVGADDGPVGEVAPLETQAWDLLGRLLVA